MLIEPVKDDIRYRLTNEKIPPPTQAVMSSSEPIVLKGRMRDEQAEQEADALLLESLLQGITEGENSELINKPEGE